jgi:hypothetical protein
MRVISLGSLSFEVIWHSDEPPPQTTYLNKRLKPAEAKRFTIERGIFRELSCVRLRLSPVLATCVINDRTGFGVYDINRHLFP